MLSPTDPAFAFSSPDDGYVEAYGLRVREYFAIHILAGFAADPTTGNLKKASVHAADTAVAWADALIAALNKDQATGS